MFDAVIAAYNHELKLLQLELNIKTKELSFYRHSLTTIHSEHIQNLFEMLSKGQKSFNEQLQRRFYEPLINVMNEYHRMSNDKTDESLKSFLFAFKIHLDQFNEIAQDLYEQIRRGTPAIDQLFIETNEQMWKQIQAEEKRFLEEIQSIKDDQRSQPLHQCLDLLHLSDQ